MPFHSSIKVDNPKQTISTCFKMTHYVVPDFQREYVWEENEIEQLLSDIEEAFEYDHNKEYFVGTTVVFDANGDLQLIDGQQRMTTFFLILCVMAKKYLMMGQNANAFEQLIYTATVDASTGLPSNYYTLELQYEDSSDCLAKIWEDAIPDHMDGLSKSNIRLFNAYNIITQKLDRDFEEFSDYMKFAAFFLHKVVFIQIGATNMADALKIFETINQRGKILNPMDLLKNMLFMSVDKELFSKLNAKWKSMIDELEKMQEKPLRFLRYYLTATYDISNVKKDFLGIIKEDDIYNWLLKNNDKCHYKEDPMAFTDGMINGLQRYKSYLNPEPDMPGRDYLINIKAIMGNAYRLHVVSLLSAKTSDSDILAGLFEAFESIIYYSVVNNIKSNTMEKLLSSWCPVIRKIHEKADFDRFIEEKVAPTIENWNIMYRANFMNLSMATMQQYKVKAILARIYKYVDSYRENSSDATDISEYIQSKVEIEHIMPRTCADISRYGAQNEDEYMLSKNRLGNLALLEKTYNATISNDKYENKCSAYKLSKYYLTKSIPELITVGSNTAADRMNSKLSSWETWSISTIDERQEMLYQLSKDVWPNYAK